MQALGSRYGMPHEMYYIRRIAFDERSMSTVLPAISVVDVGDGGALRHAALSSGRARALRDDCLTVFPRAVTPLLPALDGVARRWLTRSGSPYVSEIAEIAATLGFPGVWLLNNSYQWGCTALAREEEGVPWLARTLDWPFPGLGRHTDVVRAMGLAGEYFSVTWPGYAGVLTALAPGRFAAAINQAPRVPISGARWLDEAWGRARMLRLESAIPAAHLLRHVCEAAPDYAGAAAMLADESVLLAMPALFTLAGAARGEACVIEGLGRLRRVHRAAAADGFAIGVANDWLNGDWPGRAVMRSNGRRARARARTTVSAAVRSARCRPGRFPARRTLRRRCSMVIPCWWPRPTPPPAR